MASQTRRFGLTTFDSPADELNFQNYKFSDADRRLLDRLLRVAIEDHVHNGATASVTAPAAPALTVSPVGGAIPPNTNVHYRYSIVDSRGQETAASALATVATPVPATSPNFGPRLSLESGYMEAGEYSYALSACTNDDPSQETTVGPLATGTLTDFGGWRLDLPPVPTGAQFFNVYRKGPRETELMYWATMPPDQRFAIDYGATKTNPFRKAPRANTTNATNSIGITLPSPTPGGSWTWKIFRTYDPGNWENSFLQWNGPDTEYVDDGRDTQPGFPPSTSVAVGGAPKLDLAREAQGTPPISSINAIPRTVNLTTNRDSELPGTWAWVNDYDAVRLVSMRATIGRGTPALTQRLEVGLDVYRGAWQSVGYYNTPAVAIVNMGNSLGPSIDLMPFENLLWPGDKMRLHVWQSGHEDLPPDQIHDIALVVQIWVRGEPSNLTYVWETT